MAILAALLPLLLLCASSRANPIFDSVILKTYDDPSVNYRLPTTAKPVSYQIHLTPDLEKFTFSGESTITLKVLKKSRDITLHAKNLIIDQDTVTLSYKSEKNLNVYVDLFNPPVEIISEKEFIVIKTRTELEPKEYVLKLKYKGVLNDELRGFYRSKYTNDKGDEKWLAVTQFEPTAARLAFPCFDEPALKAKFKISITHSSKYVAISNTPAEKTENVDPNTKLTSFKETPVMSSYLVAFVVSDYAFVEENKFKVWTKPHVVDDGKYALTVGQKELKALSEFTGIDYFGKAMGMEKMDQISIPDFSAGAMENWGLVTYRESALLVNDKTTAAAKQSIGTVISHEFAHQWFGNLVSPDWWKYIWLNEGFATYFQYLATEKAEASWRLMEQFPVTAMQGTAFVIDSSDKARPIDSDAQSPNEIRSLFDGIVYQKAGSVIRMMSHMLGEEIFQKGLQNYLNKYKSMTAKSENLFAAIQEVIDKEGKPSKDFDLAKVMKNWISKAGYPIVSVQREEKSKDIVITQKQFPTPGTKGDTRWWVPITYTTADDASFSKTLPVTYLEPADDSKFKISDVKEDDWILVNKHQTGYYRVNYDKKNWQLLAKYLKSDKYENIPPVNRAQLLDDSLSLARVGELDYATVFELMSYLSQESDYIPWISAYRGLNYLNKMLVHSKKYPDFKAFVAKQVENVTETVGLEISKEDSHIDKLSRAQFIQLGCAAGLKKCLDHAGKKLDAYLGKDKTELDINVKGQLLCAGVRSAKKDKWNKVFEAYKASEDKAEKALLLAALGCTENKENLQHFTNMIFNKTYEIEDVDTAFLSVIVNTANGVDVGLDALVKNVKAIKKMDRGDAKLKTYINEIASRITLIEQQSKLGLLIVEENIPKDASVAAIQTTFNNIYWAKTYTEAVEKALPKPTKEEEEDKERGAANTATVAAFLMILPLLITRFY